MPTNTTNYGWSKPDVGGSNGAWGTLLNAIFDAVDAALFAVSGVANAALPKAGGTLTGALVLPSSSQPTNALGNVSGATTLNCANNQYFSATLGGAWSPTFGSVPAGASAIVLELTNGGSAAITWQSGVKWASGSPPALSVSGLDLLTFLTLDGGTTWIGMLSSKAAA